MSNKKLYPLTFTPQLRDYVWGGRNLETLYNRTLPPGITAESWEISGHPTATTIVDEGILKGQSLVHVLHDFGVDLVGTRAGWALERKVFPVLIKLLDANQSLSVQVHPDDDYALKYEHGSLGKTETWYILHAEPKSKIIFGLRHNVTPTTFRQSIKNDTIETQLYYLPIKAKDSILVKAGSVHALLAGTVLVEIQQTSDITYRLYDWERVGTDGKPRPLHMEKGQQVINFDQIEPTAYQPYLVYNQAGITRSEISRCKYFVVEKVELEKGASYHGHTDGQTLEIWGTTEGMSELIWHEHIIPMPTIRFCLVPAILADFHIMAKTNCTMLRVYLP
ncbi:MAG: hypothetical protein B6242_11895 [Anaerolineaceae bacterium 4572_78]|nr:MAG: hypothetical protein B6242_11895 [Anaerolineaceae bacterium 4572_78]